MCNRAMYKQKFARGVVSAALQLRLLTSINVTYATDSLDAISSQTMLHGTVTVGRDFDFIPYFLSSHGMRRHCRLMFLSVTPSTKSTKFGDRYLVRSCQNGMKFGHLIERAFLYIKAKIGDLWPRRSPGSPKILKRVKIL